ncbi:nucleotidyl transferase AbiEii/AbiGii toxin family protein [Streptococcus danieliae]|uniref:nucleotidyl transferase AbiEii/AbiGii toxin family protein n=1 Tax=Streptococcus danieliae TaxID=747656 RepID=UPI0026F1732D|nr:nucleotidyl transferase AbiEii/AbiGii toxin family protein [Streptococcus danieliae]
MTRTFLDKVLAVKRHAFNQDLLRKVRHIYDVVQLYEHPEIQNFLSDEATLKELLCLTKKTDQFYIGKRKNHIEGYNPDTPFAFESWKSLFIAPDIRKNYESLHEELLYTDVPQKFDEAIRVFEQIDSLLKQIEND